VTHQIAGACLVLGMAASLVGGEVHVSPQGNDADPGTREKPFAKVQKALGTVRGAGPATV